MKKVIITALFLSLALTGCSLSSKPKVKVITPDEAKAAALDFIKGNLISSDTTATITDIVAEGTLYKLKVNLSKGDQTQDVESYISNDGLKFFPESMEIKPASSTEDQSAVQGTKTTNNITKSDKPVVELFVMSYCPYGTQIEKGILPVVEKLGDKIDFQLKFCSYTMHGAQEVEENTRQYCINKEQSDKYLAYLSCFLEEGNSPSCLTSTGIDSSKLNSCVAATDKQYNIDSNSTDYSIYATDNQKYNVQGSPTLVINGSTVSSGRDSASLLSTICSAFNNEPAECQAQLSSATPAPGFGSGTTSSGSSASCN